MHKYVQPRHLEDEETKAYVRCLGYNTTLAGVVRKWDANALIIGNVLYHGDNDEGPINDMCSPNKDCLFDGAYGNIQSCHECSESPGNGLTGPARQLMDAWWETCVTYDPCGTYRQVTSAYDCWMSTPYGSTKCVDQALSLGGPADNVTWTEGPPLSQRSDVTHHTESSGSNSGGGGLIVGMIVGVLVIAGVILCAACACCR